MHRTGRGKMVDLYIYLYTNEHTVIPRATTGIYGSTFKKLAVSENTSYIYEFFVKRNGEINLDQARAGHRCSNDDAEVMVGRCIVRYMESANNCTTYGLMGNKTKKICNKDDKIELRNNWIDEDIFNLTGCLPKCTRDIISLKPFGRKNWPTKPGQQYVTIKFMYEDGLYIVTEEYKDYDMSSFIADVGGYLGLLLGHSVLSIYYMVGDLVMKLKDVKIKRFVSYLKTLEKSACHPAHFIRWYSRLCGCGSQNKEKK